MLTNHRLNKYLVPTALSLITISIILVLVTKNTVTPSYSISTISQGCFTEAHDLDVRAEGNSIVITAPMVTPNPCYSVGGNVNFVDSEIYVSLVPLPEQKLGLCIQCVGEVTGKVVVQNLTKGVHGVSVRTPDKAVITSITVG